MSLSAEQFRGNFFPKTTNSLLETAREKINTSNSFSDSVKARLDLYKAIFFALGAEVPVGALTTVGAAIPSVTLGTIPTVVKETPAPAEGQVENKRCIQSLADEIRCLEITTFLKRALRTVAVAFVSLAALVASLFPYGAKFAIWLYEKAQILKAAQEVKPETPIKDPKEVVTKVDLQTVPLAQTLLDNVPTKDKDAAQAKENKENNPAANPVPTCCAHETANVVPQDATVPPTKKEEKHAQNAAEETVIVATTVSKDVAAASTENKPKTTLDLQIDEILAELKNETGDAVANATEDNARESEETAEDVKARHKAEKEAKHAEEAAAKAERKAQKQAKKEAEKAEKALKEAEEAAAKAERKAKKEAEKTAKKADHTEETAVTEHHETKAHHTHKAKDDGHATETKKVKKHVRSKSNEGLDATESKPKEPKVEEGKQKEKRKSHHFGTIRRSSKVKLGTVAESPATSPRSNDAE
jgi:hypothetical protein